MGLDFLIPFSLGLASILVFAILYLKALFARPENARKHARASRTYRPETRQAYQITTARSAAAVVASLLFALAVTAALARWLPLSGLESTLLGTALLPLIWPVALVYLLCEPRWIAANLLFGATGALALAAVALLTVS
jgi:hypothetical protein